MLINQTKTYCRGTGEIAKKSQCKYDFLKRNHENKHFNHHYIFALKIILAAFEKWREN
jgi:hypothetical protein